MSRWRVYTEAVLFYLGGLNVGAILAYLLLMLLREENQPVISSPFAKYGSPVPILVVIGCALLGPFLIQALLNRFKWLYVPLLTLSILLVSFDLYLFGAAMLAPSAQVIPSSP